MRATSAFRRGLIRDILPVLMALALCLRVMAAPMMLPVMVDGRITLCLGGQLVQVKFDPADPSAPKISSDSCPLLGVTAALETSATPELRAATDIVAIAHVADANPRPAAAPARRYRARAPPVPA